MQLSKSYVTIDIILSHPIRHHSCNDRNCKVCMNYSLYLFKHVCLYLRVSVVIHLRSQFNLTTLSTNPSRDSRAPNQDSLSPLSSPGVALPPSLGQSSPNCPSTPSPGQMTARWEQTCTTVHWASVSSSLFLFFSRVSLYTLYALGGRLTSMLSSRR